MILEKIKALDIQTVGDATDGFTAGISEASLPFIFEILSKGFYSNAIGSIVREITSNCFDSHIEAKVDEPVIISKGYDSEEGYYIEFKDVGVGLSPERVQTIYINYFSSTKRIDNTQIGGFGLGSKTPLAYADLFYITTISNGLKYEYVFHKGEDKPKLESLLGYEDEDCPECDEVISFVAEDKETEETLEIEEEKTEQIKATPIARAKVPIGLPTEEHNGTTIKIIIDNTPKSNYSETDLQKFEYELKYQLAYFDSVYFKGWNISNHYDIYEGDYFKFRSDIDQNRTEIHICIGKVIYSIDFKYVSVPQKYRNIPIAVKFEIGELQVTPSRETLRYSEQTVKLVLERIELAARELLEMFEAQNPEIEDLDTYIKLLTEVPKVTFDKAKGHSLYIWSHSGIDKNYKFKPICHLPIKKTPKNLFFMWERVGYIDYGVRKMHSNPEVVSNELINKRNFIVVTKEDRFSSYTDLYTKELIGINTIYLIKKKELDYDTITRDLGIKDSKTVGKAKTIMEYIKIMNSIVFEKGYLYSELRPSDKWIEDYKESVREQSAAYLRKKNKKVFVRDMAYGSRNGIEMSILELEARTGILVYGFKEDQKILYNIHSIVANNKGSIKKITDRTRRNKAFMVIQVARSSERDIIGAEKTIYWEDFLKTKFFRKIITCREIENRISKLEIDAIENRKKYLPDFEKDFLELKKYYYKDYKDTFYIDTEKYDIQFIESMFTILENFIKRHVYPVPLISAINTYLYDEDLKEVISYFKYKKVRLKKEFYLKTKKQLIEEARSKQLKIEIDTIIAMIQTPEIFTQTKLLTYTKITENVNIKERNNYENSSEESSSFTEEDLDNYF